MNENDSMETGSPTKRGRKEILAQAFIQQVSIKYSHMSHDISTDSALGLGGSGPHSMFNCSHQFGE